MAPIIALLLLGLGGAAKSFAEVAVYTVSPCQTAPNLDGRLDDECWRAACAVESFSLIGKPGESSAGVSTKAFLTFDADFLYVAFDCEEPLAQDLVLKTKEHDGPSWQDDGVEIFLNPSGDRSRYVQIAINAAGVVMDAFIAEPRGKLDLGYETGIEIKTLIGYDRWSLECRIPFSGLPLAAPDADWTFHFARNRKRAGQLISALKSPVSGYHEIEKFDVLRGIQLPQFPVSVEALSFGEGFQGTNSLSARLKNWKNEPLEVAGVFGLEGNDRIKKPLQLSGGEQRDLIIPYSLAAGDGGKSLDFELWLGEKLLHRRLSRLSQIPPVLGALTIRAFYQAPDDFVRLEIPVKLASGSRPETRLSWTAMDATGKEVGRGFTSVGGASAVLRLFWPSWYPGRYRLKLKLARGESELATCQEELRLLPSPWGGGSRE